VAMSRETKVAKVGAWIALALSIALVLRVIAIDNAEAIVIVAPALVGALLAARVVADARGSADGPRAHRCNGDPLADRLDRAALRPLTDPHRPCRRSYFPNAESPTVTPRCCVGIPLPQASGLRIWCVVRELRGWWYPWEGKGLGFLGGDRALATTSGRHHGQAIRIDSSEVDLPAILRRPPGSVKALRPRSRDTRRSTHNERYPRIERVLGTVPVQPSISCHAPRHARRPPVVPG
jgi:hypothetical protein